MSYIAMSSDPFIVTGTNMSVDKLSELAELVKKDIFPGEKYTNYEVQMWVVMRKLVDDVVDGKNHYKKYGRVKVYSQELHAL